MSLQELKPQITLQSILNQHLGKLVVLVFYADWNKQSLKFKDSLMTSLPLFGQFDNVVYLAASVERYPDAFKAFSVEYVPTVLFTDSFKKILRRFESEDVAGILDALPEEFQNYRLNFEKEKKVWSGKINNIIQEAPVIIFMQGTPESPNQNHSKNILNIFKKHGVEFICYNVIDNPSISQWIKVYSGFQSFPQVFVSGKFVGDAATLDEKELISKIPSSCLQLSGEEKLKSLLNSHKALILTDKFANEVNQLQALTTLLKLSQGELSVYNVAINQRLHDFVLQNYERKFPLVFVNQQLQK